MAIYGVGGEAHCIFVMPTLLAVLTSIELRVLTPIRATHWLHARPLHTHTHTYTHRQLHTLWERMEALRRENSVLNERLENEIQMQKKTQAELYSSRAQVGYDVPLKLATLIHVHPWS